MDEPWLGGTSLGPEMGTSVDGVDWQNFCPMGGGGGGPYAKTGSTAEFTVLSERNKIV